MLISAFKVSEDDLPDSFFQEIQRDHFPRVAVEKLRTVWVERKEVGLGGQKRSHGEWTQKAAKRQRLTTRRSGAGRKCDVLPVIEAVRPIFDHWRMGGVYVDEEDLLIEYQHQAKET